jgi:opacity protein-like surface antigen
MKKLLLLALLAAALLPGAARAQWSLGMRLGYAHAAGNAVKGSPMSDGVKSQVPVQLEGAYRVLPQLDVGAYGAYGVAQVGSLCQGSCSASVLRLGVQAAWRFAEVKRFTPWAGAGAGYEWSRYKTSTSGDTLEVTLHGLELLQLQGGADWKLGERFTVGPFASLAFGRYSKLDVKSPLGASNGGTPSKTAHSWLTFGVRGTYSL